MRNKFLVLFILALSFNAQADLILDVAFEQNQNGLVSDGGWYTTSQQSGYFGGTNNPEGGTIAHVTNFGDEIYSADLSGGDLTIEEGIYSIFFSAGNWNNEGFLDLDITFAGMSQSIATSQSNATPSSGEWELWSFTWEVLDGSQYIGNALSFKALSVGSSSNNSAIDGVGHLSQLGDGFLVTHTVTEVSEPPMVALFGLSLLALSFARSRKN